MKLHICGASGSGVTTTGRLLADKLGIQYFDSDDYFWISANPPFIKRRSSEERNGQIQKDLNQSENWILGGSVIDWGEHIFPDFDLIIFYTYLMKSESRDSEKGSWKNMEILYISTKPEESNLMIS